LVVARGQFVALLVIFSCALILSATPEVARAQSSSEVAAARRLFREGLTQARRGEWEQAISQFERSYAIAPRPNTLINLAGAQAQTGRLVEAAEVYRRFLAEAGSGQAQFRSRAEEALAALEERFAQITLEVDGVAPSDHIMLGERELTHAVLGVAMPIDPGSATLVIRRADEEILREEIELGEGESRDVRFEVAPELTVTSVPETDSGGSAPDGALIADSDESGGDDTGLIVGIVVTVIALVAAGAIVTTVLLLDGGTYQGNLGRGQIEFD
jgi:hypothetical protein